MGIKSPSLDERVGHIEIGGVTYPAIYSMYALFALNDENIEDGNKRSMNCLSAMLNSGYEYSKDKDNTIVAPPSYEELMANTNPNEWQHINDQMIEIIKKGQIREVETEKKESKTSTKK